MTPRSFSACICRLATRIRLSELVGCSPSAGAARRDQLRSECGDVGHLHCGHRPGGLQHHLAKASWPKITSVIQAYEPNATGDRFRDPLFVMFSRANLVNTLRVWILRT